ncbi:MAG TPA: sugar-binding domain-containing protein, partial [Verrucomicrobiae bacterium]
MKVTSLLTAPILTLLVTGRLALATVAEPSRWAISLDGPWQFQRGPLPTNAWRTVTVPSTFQDHEGNAFHGVGWYRREIAPFELPPGRRVLLHFEAAATAAEVWWNGERLGAHLGGWTPFRFDVTDLVRRAAAGQPHEVRVRLDEKVGHNTQGFLTIIEPHFGGLWQPVKLLGVPETYVDDLCLHAYGNPLTHRLELHLPLCGSSTSAVDSVRVRRRPRGATGWSAETTQAWP